MKQIPFEAGKKWSKLKTILFNLLFDQLRITYEWLNPSDINFISELTGIKGLVIESNKKFDITPLSSCLKLNYLNMSWAPSKKTKLDLSKLNLGTYVGVDSGVMSTIYSSHSVKRLVVSNCSLIDLTKVDMINVEHLVIDGSKTLKSLKGVEKLHKIRVIELEKCHKITDLKKYSNNMPKVKIYNNGLLI